MQFLLFIILLLCANFLNGCPAFPKCCVEYCYSEDTVRHQNYLMNTKTAYQLVKGQHPINPPSGCTPSKLWLLSRHGTRLPTAKSIKKMEKLPQIRTEILANYAHGNYPTEGPLCDADLKLLANWNWDANITEDLGDFLTVQGWNDLKGLAEFYKKQFPGMFGEYSPEKFHFRHSNTQRADASYKAFIDGMYGDNANERIPNPPVPERDTLLRPYDLCPAWAQHKEDLDDPSSEVSKFKASSLYRKVIEDVSTKAGYSSPLTVKTVESMFELCAFEVAWRIGGDSPWCTLFTEDQIRVLEYARDMTEWYESGSATDLNGRLTCELVQDMIDRLSSVEEPTTIGYFGHASTFQLFLTSLGLYTQDVPLLSDNYDQMANRTWRTSKISPFATNMAVVRYECSMGSRIQFILNQRPLEFDWCEDTLCDLGVLKERLKIVLNADCQTFFCPAERRISVSLYSN